MTKTFIILMFSMSTEYIKSDDFINENKKGMKIVFEQIYDIDVIENHLIKFEHILDTIIKFRKITC